jgi:predicted phosphodiesterase
MVVKNESGKVASSIPKSEFKGMAWPKDLGEKKGSFAVFSDIHISTPEAANRFKNAVVYVADVEKVDFICISGDLVNGSNTTAELEAQLRDYISLVATAKSLCVNKIEIHDTTGNHDVQSKAATKSYLQEYADGRAPYNTRELYYSFTHCDSLFIMFGMSGWPGKTGALYSDESYTWLEEALAANKDKRCFLFSHPPYFTYDSASGLVCDSGSGAIVGMPPPTGTYIQWYADSAPRFKNALNSHPNLIWFHGHTHMEFFRQEVAPYVNYCRENFESNSLAGCHSVHVPSLAVGRELNSAGNGWTAPADTRGGEGYIVDRYEKYVVLRGFNFVEKRAVPIATYCIKT